MSKWKWIKELNYTKTLNERKVNALWSFVNAQWALCEHRARVNALRAHGERTQIGKVERFECLKRHYLSQSVFLAPTLAFIKPKGLNLISTYSQTHVWETWKKYVHILNIEISNCAEKRFKHLMLSHLLI